jgi:hypothetical protein
MKRPIESDYKSQVAYTRALEAYCDTLAQPKPAIIGTYLEKDKEQEPVASIFISGIGEREFDDWGIGLPMGRNILYTTPPQRTWKGLTEEDIDDAEIHLTSCRNNHESWIEGIQEFAQAIEAKLKEKNT